MFGPTFGFLLVMSFTALPAACCASLFACIAYVRMAAHPENAKRIALFTFSGTIPCNIAAMISVRYLPQTIRNGIILGVDSNVVVISTLLFTSFVLVMVTLGLLYGYTGSGKRPLQIGSISLIVRYGLGCIGVFIP